MALHGIPIKPAQKGNASNLKDFAKRARKRDQPVKKSISDKLYGAK